MTDLEKLQLLVKECPCDCRALTNEQLDLCLSRAGGDIEGAAYYAALLKAEASGITLPDGVTLADNREYWLGIAQMYRPNRGGVARRDAP